MKENNVRTKEIPDSEMPELMREAFRGTAVNKPTDVVYPYMDGTERNITIIPILLLKKQYQISLPFLITSFFILFLYTCFSFQ